MACLGENNRRSENNRFVEVVVAVKENNRNVLVVAVEENNRNVVVVAVEENNRNVVVVVEGKNVVVVVYSFTIHEAVLKKV